jgi:predicted dehydrogenase
VVLDLMIHDLDIVNDLVGMPVKSVEAVGVPVLSPTEDIANVRLNFEGGCVANLTASRVTTKQERKIRIFSKESYLSVDYLKREVKVYRLKEGANPAAAGSLVGLSRMVEIETLPIHDAEQLKLELESFLKSVGSGEHPEVSGRQGRMALALGLEVQKQVAEHQRRMLG